MKKLILFLTFIIIPLLANAQYILERNGSRVARINSQGYVYGRQNSDLGRISLKPTYGDYFIYNRNGNKCARINSSGYVYGYLDRFLGRVSDRPEYGNYNVYNSDGTKIGYISNGSIFTRTGDFLGKFVKDSQDLGTSINIKREFLALLFIFDLFNQ